ncbi:unnamed protein product [Prorocentrum cordatum]|uniref:Fe2OG dioxygenase domain-containing protein n=1 Tax=Prorocentrum cordatum TaxID=2364126 RepID=A0ABN9RGJ6_9DINO|nr:unnamed protein product [Polarella glacialis]
MAPTGSRGHAAVIAWLDSTLGHGAGATRGPCSQEDVSDSLEGDAFADVSVTYTNFMHGEIGSTVKYRAGPAPLAPPRLYGDLGGPIPEADAGIAGSKKGAWVATMSGLAMVAAALAGAAGVVVLGRRRLPATAGLLDTAPEYGLVAERAAAACPNSGTASRRGWGLEPGLAQEAGQESSELFQLRWDGSIFSTDVLEELNEQERGSFASPRKELLAAKDLLQSHSGKVREKLAAARRLAATSRQRLAKKRKGGDGDAKDPAQAVRVAPAAPAEKADDPPLAAAAAKLSQAKFKAAEQATAATAARGASGSAGPGAAPPDAEDRDLGSSATPPLLELRLLNVAAPPLSDAAWYRMSLHELLRGVQAPGKAENAADADGAAEADKAVEAACRGIAGAVGGGEPDGPKVVAPRLRTEPFTAAITGAASQRPLEPLGIRSEALLAATAQRPTRFGERPAKGPGLARGLVQAAKDRLSQLGGLSMPQVVLELPLEEQALDSGGVAGPIALRNGDYSGWTLPMQDRHTRSFVSHKVGAFDRQTLKLWFGQLCSLKWNRPVINGRLLPRSAAWMTQQGCACTYRYSGTSWPAQQMDPWFLEITKRVCAECGITDIPNCCNVNLYEDGKQTVGWHSDDEPLFDSLTQDTLIISLSLGAQRTFLIRPNADQSQVTKVVLADGDIMTMEGLTQKHYKHSVMPESNVLSPRINLTWRWVRRHEAACPMRAKTAPGLARPSMRTYAMDPLKATVSQFSQRLSAKLGTARGSFMSRAAAGLTAKKPPLANPTARAAGNDARTQRRPATGNREPSRRRGAAARSGSRRQRHRSRPAPRRRRDASADVGRKKGERDKRSASRQRRGERLPRASGRGNLRPLRSGRGEDAATSALRRGDRREVDDEKEARRRRGGAGSDREEQAKKPRVERSDCDRERRAPRASPGRRGDEARASPPPSRGPDGKPGAGGDFEARIAAGVQNAVNQELSRQARSRRSGSPTKRGGARHLAGRSRSRRDRPGGRGAASRQPAASGAAERREPTPPPCRGVNARKDMPRRRRDDKQPRQDRSSPGRGHKGLMCKGLRCTRRGS